MKCPNCEKKIPDDSKFCLECGSNISSISAQSGIEGGALMGRMEGLVRGGGGASDPSALSIGDMKTRVGTRMPNDSGLRHEPLSGRYELQGVIGRGGFAEVHKALDKKLGRTVAVKKLHPEHDAMAVARFRREAQSIAQLNHQNVVSVYDVGEENGEIWLVMEYITGGSLRDFMKRKGKLNLSEALALFTGIAQGLAYAHRKNLVHRDVKPSNILLQREGGDLIPKIVDFGLAQAGRDSDLSISGYGMGTPWYMPPEQRRDAKNVNHTADIYALGKVLYEMLTSEIPDNVDPSVIPPPRELSDIIFKCVKSKPEDRFFSVDELLRELEKIEGQKKKQKNASKGNECLACGTSNAKDVRFCMGCGGGLFRNCPECGRENSVKEQFCGTCGTDVEGFLAVQEILSRMEKYTSEEKWSRVLKEAEGLSADVRMSGKRGRELRAAIKLSEKKANQAIAKIKRPAKVAGGSSSVGAAGEPATLGNDKSPGKRSAKKRRQPVKAMLASLLFLFCLLFIAGWIARSNYSLIEDEIRPLPDPYKQCLVWLLAPRDHMGEDIGGIPIPANALPLTNSLAVSAPSLSQTDRSAIEYLMHEINGFKIKDYHRAVEDTSEVYANYGSVIRNLPEHEQVERVRRFFWATLELEIITAYAIKQEPELIALANGVYIAGLEDYANILGTTDVAVLQVELTQDIQNIMQNYNTNYNAHAFFPVLASRNFKVNETAVDRNEVRIRNVLDKHADCYGAVYLPLSASLSLRKKTEEKKGISMNFALVPFCVLSDSDSVEGWPLMEKKIISPFYISVAETTWEEMEVFWNDRSITNEAGEIRRSEPYDMATLEEAIEYCNWLSEKDGLSELYKKSGETWRVDLRKAGYRLPFDFEWEYAARFGFDFCSEEWPEYKPWHEMRDQLQSANLLVNYSWIQELRSPDSNFRYPLGVYDMCGNAREICMTADSCPAKPDVLEVGFTVMAGGPGISDPDVVVPWLRDGRTKNETYFSTMKSGKADYGFRVIRTVPVKLFE